MLLEIFIKLRFSTVTKSMVTLFMDWLKWPVKKLKILQSEKSKWNTSHWFELWWVWALKKSVGTSMAKKPVKYTLVCVSPNSVFPFLITSLIWIIVSWVRVDNQVDAFTESVFKGNPAAVCLLEEERDKEWFRAVAAEFNLSVTAYVTRITESHHNLNSLHGTSSNPRFHLRWFTPVTEVNLPASPEWI